jgi:nitric oxide reductase NorD protein
MFRALGGDRGVRIAPGGPSPSAHRLSLRQRLGIGVERIDRAVLDGATLQLPLVFDLFPERADNHALYDWLTAYFACAEEPWTVPPDPLRADVDRLRRAAAITARVLERWPGLRPLHQRLCAGVRTARPRRRLPNDEAAVEDAVLALLGTSGAGADPAQVAALLDPTVPLNLFRCWRRYRPFLPVPLWGEVVESQPDAQRHVDEQEGTGDSAGDEKRRHAKRRSNERAQRDDPLILNRFEKIIGFAEMINLNRSVEDDDADAARKAAEDLDEITVGRHERKAATRLKLELDLAPEAADTTPLAKTCTYPEWDYKRRLYHPNHCRVIAEPAALEGEDWQPDEVARRRIRRVRRQFEALRPRRQILTAQPDGDELDLSAVVRSIADRRAGGPGSDSVYTIARTTARELSVAVLVDVSLSTDSWIEDRRVLDVEKEALLALSGGLSACGDEHGIFTFTSQRRKAVWVRTVKDFDQQVDARTLRRIQALRPGHYTRMGAAVRHVAQQLDQRPQRHRLLLILTDGKPNDSDHYEGRFAVEDTRMAIRETQRLGIKVFGITVDRAARDYFPYVFGPGAYSIFPHISRLPTALPAIYRQLTS